MKPFSLRRGVAFLGKLALTGWLGLGGVLARAEESPAVSATATATNSAEADKAWRETYKATRAPAPPAEWQEKEPSPGEVAKFYLPALISGADKAKDFYTRFPQHAKARDARALEYKLLSMAAQRYGDTTQTARLEALEKARMDDPNLGEDERFQLRMQSAQRLMTGLPQTMAEVEKAVRAMQKDFPKHEEVYQLLMMAASESEGEKGRSLAQEIINGPAPDSVKEQARGLLNRLEAVGKPVVIQYTAVDGREVNVAKMREKVVLIDFWATWCPPCVGEVPNVKAAYEKLHDKGFEIVGISFDQSKEALEKFVAKQEMAWPQYFDGEGWGNKFGKQFGINGIPTMWLVDKKGNLRDVNARGALEEKVTKLLAE